jgi:hypothetical protein
LERQNGGVLMIQIEMHGLEEVQKMLLELPEHTEIEIDKAQKDFMSFVQKYAKLMAPKFSGQLAESIVFKQTKKNIYQLTVESPYGFFQEYGFTGRFLSAGMPVQGGYRIGDWMAAKGIKGFGIKPSGRPHPFIQPALESGLNHLPSMLQNAIYKAVKESK